MHLRPRSVALASAALALPLAVALAPSAGAATTTEVVTPDNLHGWQQFHLNDETAGCTTTSTGSQDWVVGPSTPPAGVGSHEFSIGSNGNSYEKLRTGDYDGT